MRTKLISKGLVLKSSVWILLRTALSALAIPLQQLRNWIQPIKAALNLTSESSSSSFSESQKVPIKWNMHIFNSVSFWPQFFNFSFRWVVWTLTASWVFILQYVVILFWIFIMKLPLWKLLLKIYFFIIFPLGHCWFLESYSHLGQLQLCYIGADLAYLANSSFINFIFFCSAANYMSIFCMYIKISHSSTAQRFWKCCFTFGQHKFHWLAFFKRCLLIPLWKI